MPGAAERQQQVRAAIEESIAVKQELLGGSLEAAVQVADTISESLRAGGTVLLAGNGGSAADAQHIAAELVGRFKLDRPALAALALTTDSSVLTSLTNDMGGEVVFSRQVEALGREGDVLIVLSTSGASPNVLAAVQAARERGLRTVAFTRQGGELAAQVDVALAVPSESTARIQEAHITLAHAICELVEAELASG